MWIVVVTAGRQRSLTMCFGSTDSTADALMKFLDHHKYNLYFEINIEKKIAGWNGAADWAKE